MRCLGFLIGGTFGALTMGLTVGAVVLAIFPRTAYIMRPLVCESGATISHITYTTSTSDGQATNYSYFCEKDGQKRTVTGFVIVSYLAVWTIAFGGLIMVARIMFGMRRGLFGTAQASIPLTPQYFATGGQPVTLALSNAQLTISPQAWAGIQQNLSRGNKIGAIKVLRDATGLGLKEAKDVVEAIQHSPQAMMEQNMVQSEAPSFNTDPISVSAETKAEIQGYLMLGQKMNAIKAMREATGWGLKEAKDYVDAMERGEQL